MARRNRRKRRNRGRFGALYKLLSALLIFAAVLTGCVVFFRVDSILVTGQSQYTEEEIIQVAGVKQGDNLFRLNKSYIAEQVITSLPYVDKISISRKLPDTLVLTVTECIPAVTVQVEGETWLLDVKCKLLERGEAAQGHTVAALYGITPLAPAVGQSLEVDEAETQRLESLRGLLSALSAEQMTGSVRGFMDLTADNKIRFSYGDALTVVMPMIADFDRYVFRLKRTLLNMDDNGVERAGTLDLSYEDGAHLFPERWMPDPQAVATPSPTPEPTPEPGAAVSQEPQTPAQGD